MKQRKWEEDEKFAHVLEGPKEKRSMADFCREHKIRRSFSSVHLASCRIWIVRNGGINPSILDIPQICGE